ncbi:hypothetical protein Lepto7375DRAFT_1643 [Leptolyngbya sp. PCC 7375]|nr:hypothetical protein Lepto7375DRAFT_1643 [Leptolyngbya sp. PCC 7375]
MNYRLFVSVAIALTAIPMVGQRALAKSQSVPNGVVLSGLVAEVPTVIESPDVGAEAGAPELPVVGSGDPRETEQDAPQVNSTSGEPSVQDAPQVTSGEPADVPDAPMP